MLFNLVTLHQLFLLRSPSIRLRSRIRVRRVLHHAQRVLRINFAAVPQGRTMVRQRNAI